MLVEFYRLTNLDLSTCFNSGLEKYYEKLFKFRPVKKEPSAIQELRAHYGTVKDTATRTCK